MTAPYRDHEPWPRATPKSHFPLGATVICAACEYVFEDAPACPCCTSTQIEGIEPFVARRAEARQRAAFVARCEAEVSRLVGEVK